MGRCAEGLGNAGSFDVMSLHPEMQDVSLVCLKWLQMWVREENGTGQERDRE